MLSRTIDTHGTGILNRSVIVKVWQERLRDYDPRVGFFRHDAEREVSWDDGQHGKVISKFLQEAKVKQT